MLRAARARRIAAATAFSGGGLTVAGAGAVAFLYLQARLARRAVGFTPWRPPRVDGVHGQGEGPPIRMLVMGDSAAAGFAVTDARHTPGVLLATGLSEVADRPVDLRCTARPGATSAGLVEQLAAVRGRYFDLAVVFIGANDVIRRVRPADAVGRLRETVRELAAQGTEVVVATCPDLGTVQPLGWPLRSLARRVSRQLAAAQTIAVIESGGRTVSLSSLLADEFRTDPDSMFGPDRFHPSARGYAQAASVVLPSVCVALGLLPELEESEDAERMDALPVDRAAVEAVEEPGTEVSGARVAGREHGPRGRWAALIRRRRSGSGLVGPERESA